MMTCRMLAGPTATSLDPNPNGENRAAKERHRPDARHEALGQQAGFLVFQVQQVAIMREAKRGTGGEDVHGDVEQPRPGRKRVLGQVGVACDQFGHADQCAEPRGAKPRRRDRTEQVPAETKNRDENAAVTSTGTTDRLLAVPSEPRSDTGANDISVSATVGQTMLKRFRALCANEVMLTTSPLTWIRPRDSRRPIASCT